MGQSGHLLQSPHQLGDGETKRNCERPERTEARFFSAEFEVGYIVLRNPCVFGEVKLSPPALFTQFPKVLAELLTDVPCHPNHSGDMLAVESKP